MLSFSKAKGMKPIKIFKKEAKISWAEREITFQIKGNGKTRSDNPTYYVRLLEENPKYAFYDNAKIYAKAYADSRSGDVAEDVSDIIVSNLDFNYFIKETLTGKKINAVSKMIDKKVVTYAYYYVDGFRRYVMERRSIRKYKYSSAERRTPHISNPHRFFRPISGLNLVNTNRTLIESGDLINSFTANVYDSKKNRIMEVN